MIQVHLLLLILGLIGQISPKVSASSLVGPGALSPYTGGGGGGRGPQRWGTVREFPAGFLIAGSSIPGVNGLYSKLESDPGNPHAFVFSYWNPYTKFRLVYAHAKDEGYEPVGRKETEWVIVDAHLRDLFGHEGDTYLPGAGDSWKHVYRPAHVPATGFGVGDKVRMRNNLEGFWDKGDSGRILSTSPNRPEAPFTIQMEKNKKQFQTQVFRMSKVGVDGSEFEDHSRGLSQEKPHDDEDELPWQVVAIMSQERLAEFEAQQRQHEHTRQQARTGAGLPPPPSPHGSQELAPPPSHHSQPQHGGHASNTTQLWQEARVACGEGKLSEGLALWEEGVRQSEGGLTGGDAWTRAQMHVGKAACYRRARAFVDAKMQIGAAMNLFPRFAAAWFERALVEMDEGSEDAAIVTLETLLRMDRDWPKIDEWLVAAHARSRRSSKGGYVGVSYRMNVPGGVRIGQQVNMASRIEGFWEEGEPAEVVSLGTPNAPLTIRLSLPHRQGRLVHCQLHETTPRPDKQPRLSGGSEPAGTSNPSTLDNPLDETLGLNHYLLMRVPADFTGEELRRAYRESSRRLHPDKGGSAGSFERVALANDILSDPSKRKAYDAGEDLSKLEGDTVTLKKEVERRYFPDRVDFLPFGDPFEKKREVKERRERMERQRIEREEMMKRRQQERVEALNRAKMPNDEL